MRKLVIFGNGLGRALDNEFFDLENGLRYAWHGSGLLEEAQKRLIQQCLPAEVIEGEVADFPRREEELDRLQRVLAACDEISKHEISDEVRWLSDHGRQFPRAIRSFIHSAASYFHSGQHSLPATFMDPLIDWIRSSRSHIATLNYDDLLYRGFIGTDVFNGYSCLIDGFVGPFDCTNLDRFRSASQAYYLHLHGSPLYHSNQNDQLMKAALGDLPSLEGHSKSHIVLTHVDHKASVIASSQILRCYWQRLEEAMDEVEAVVLFGYGGGDNHLNRLVQEKFRAKAVEIVERHHSDYDNDEGKNLRHAFWKKRVATGSQLHLHWPEDILTFTSWG